MELRGLPIVAPGAVGALVVCEPEVRELRPEIATASSIDCDETLRLGLSVLASLQAPSPDRLYLERPDCAVATCTEDELSTAVLHAWIGTERTDLAFDARISSALVTIGGDGEGWPALGTSTIPRAMSPTIDGAPEAVAERPPFPSCGRKNYGCFRDGVVAGRPVEVTYVHPVSHQIEVLRFEGEGPVVRYMGVAGGPWVASLGVIYADDHTMTGFGIWSETETPLE